MTDKQDHLQSRRNFVTSTAALAASSGVAGNLRDVQAATGPEPAERICPLLTPANDFRNVSRGNPKPDTLTGQAVVDAGLTPDTWRLQITADPAVDPPQVGVPASIHKPLQSEDGTALDLPSLLKLGESHEVAYIKAMQCLNIPAPLGQGLWEGVPLRTVLQQCGRLNNVRRIYYWGFHNRDPDQVFQSSLSYAQVMETPPGELPVFLAYRLNGEPIPLVRGGPVRMIVPWAFGFKSIKWLQHIFVTNDYRTNDTYALKNNDPESSLKTAAYVNQGPTQVAFGQDLLLTGQVISGQSGLERVEYWVRKVNANVGLDVQPSLADDAPELLAGPWIPCELEEPPDWESALPGGQSTRRLLGFDPATGKPLSWPLRYGMAGYRAVIQGLAKGHYEIRARAVDLNGFAQPEPRPLQKSGKNSIQVWRVEVV